jgi:hypothetical protein
MGQVTSDIRERAETIGMFFNWPGFEEGTPPRQEDNKAVDPRRSPERNARHIAIRRDLSPPLHDLATKSMDLYLIVLSVVVRVLIE